MKTRRFPAPWSVRELEQAFRVEDATGQAVAFTYFRKDENEARQAQLLTYTFLYAGEDVIVTPVS